VGVLAAVTGMAFLVALTFFRKGGYSEKESYLVYALFSDATGLTWKSRVQIAGIQIGEVVDIVLSGAKARLDIRVKNGIELHSDACLTKTFPSALLPDALLEVQPGSADKPLLASLPEGERRISCVREATSVQQLMDSLAKIATDVQLVTGDLAQTVAGDKGLREIVENLASATRRVDEAIARNEDSFAGIIANTRDFTADLREISRRDKDKIGRIATNIEELTAQLRTIAASLQEIIDPGAPTGGSAPPPPRRRGEAPLPGGGKVAAAYPPDPTVPPDEAVQAPLPPGTPPERRAVAEQARGMRQAVERLTASLEQVEQLVSRVNEGKSIAGRLLVDERLGRKVGTAAEDLADQLDRIFKLQIQLQLRSEWLLNQTGAKTYFGVRLLPRPDKFYLLEIVADPRGVDTRRTDTLVRCTGVPGSPGVCDPILADEITEVTTRTEHEEKLTFSAQIGKRYGPFTFRVGVIESSGGVGADLHLFRDSLQLSASIYQFSRPYEDVFPRAKVWMNYYLFQHFFLTAGADDFLNSWDQGRYPGGPKFTIGNDVFFGAGLFFTDDDLKTLLGAGAGSAVPSGG
jgi:phospholipid/cholesterol/gamma-HCH transport system substrate-binding protein